MENNVLLHLAIIVFFSKVLGAISKKFKQPPVIEMLFLGIVLGPTLLHFIEPDLDYCHQLRTFYLTM
jgi:Kef-type K+ transport system membrane component KefB